MIECRPASATQRPFFFNLLSGSDSSCTHRIKTRTTFKWSQGKCSLKRSPEKLTESFSVALSGKKDKTVETKLPLYFTVTE